MSQTHDDGDVFVDLKINGITILMDECVQSRPCGHRIRYHSDGFESGMCGTEICRLYMEAGLPIPEHFEQYQDSIYQDQFDREKSSKYAQHQQQLFTQRRTEHNKKRLETLK